MQNWPDTILSQYAESSVLLGIIGSLNAAIDPAALIDQFYTMRLDLDTAQGEGLDVWGRILGVGRVLKIATASYLGFSGSPGAASGDSFNTAPFYAGQATTANYPLSDTGFRTLLIAKAFSNISDGSIPSINQILRILFPGTNAHVVDGLNMTLTYTFSGALSPVQQAIVLQSGVLPKPVGVLAMAKQGSAASANATPAIS